MRRLCLVCEVFLQAGHRFEYSVPASILVSLVVFLMFAVDDVFALLCCLAYIEVCAMHADRNVFSAG